MSAEPVPAPSGQDIYLAAIDAASEPVTEYDRGFRAGYRQAVLEVKAAEHGITAIFAEHADLQVRRWGPGGRARFGDPRPGDYRGKRGAT